MANEGIRELRREVEILSRSLGAINERMAAIGPANGDTAALRRKILDLDMRLARIERGEALAILATNGEPYSE